MNKRIFISHASEDKIPFVKNLAQTLKTANFDIWYDEYQIKTSVSIRENIDKGLACCDCGLIILSNNYFKKRWTKLELNAFFAGLVLGEKIIIPILYNITIKEVYQLSPLLNDFMNIDGSLPINEIVNLIKNALYPKKTTFEKVRDFVESKGLKTPEFYNDWWIEVIQMDSNIDKRTPWFFPNSIEDHDLAYKLSWNALKLNWLKKYSTKWNQFTSPEVLTESIKNTPGMSDILLKQEYLATYAPQLLFYTNKISEELKMTAEKHRILIPKTNKNYHCIMTNDGQIPIQNRIFAISDDLFGNYKSSYLLQHFVEGENLGVRPSTLDYWEILILLNTQYSLIYPQRVVDKLLDGYKCARSYKILEKRIVVDLKLEEILKSEKMLHQVCQEIYENNLSSFNFNLTEVVKGIKKMNLFDHIIGPEDYRITIPNEDFHLNFRGITFQRK